MEKTSFFSRHKKTILILVTAVILGGGFLFLKAGAASNSSSTCDLERVTKGSLSRSLSISGKVSSANNTSISTSASGVIREVYIKEGDQVKAGDKIAKIELDQQSKQAEARAYAAYLSSISAYETAENAKTALDIDLDNNRNTLATAEQSKTSLQAAIDTAKQALVQAQENLRVISEGIYIGASAPVTGKKYSMKDLESAKLAVQAAEKSLTAAQNKIGQTDASIESTKKLVSLSEEKYQDTAKSLSEANANLRAARMAWELAGSIVKAPVDGVVKGLTVIPGMSISTSTTSTTNKLAYVETGTTTLVTADASENDIPYIKLEQKAEVTFDAFPNKTFKGKIITINTGGSTATGSTTYPIAVQLLDPFDGLLPNMSAEINLKTESQSNVLVVPTKAIDDLNDKTVVQKFENGKLTDVEVEIGGESETQTEIKSGLKEGDLINADYITDKKALKACRPE